MSHEPCRLCREHLIAGGHALTKGQLCHTQVLVGLGEIGLGGLIGLEGLLIFEVGLCYLELYLLFGLFHFEVLNLSIDKCGFVFVAQPAPVPERNLDNGTNGIVEAKLLLEAIIDMRIGGEHTAHSSHSGQHLAACHFSLFVKDLHAQLQGIEVVAALIDLRHVDGSGLEWNVKFSSQLIGKNHRLIEGLATELCQRHACQHQSVAHLGECHVSLIHLHIHAQQCGIGSHALLEHLLHVVVESSHQVEVALSEAFL